MSTRTRDVIWGGSSLIPALIITFVANHSLSTGLTVFGVWALLTGILLAALGRKTALGSLGWLFTATVGAATLVLATLGEAQVFGWIVGGWSVLFAGWIAWRGGRELRLVSGIFFGLGLLELFMPINAVVNVGVLGAAFVLVAVWLVIGALSPRATLNAEGAVNLDA